MADLRNANRFVTRYFSGANRDKLEIVLNRYLARNIEIDEVAITKALTGPQNGKSRTITLPPGGLRILELPIASEKNQIAHALARDGEGGLAVEIAAPGKKKMFGLFG